MKRSVELAGKTVLFFCGAASYYGAEAASVTHMRVLRAAGARVVCVTSGWTDGVFQGVLKREGIEFHVIKCGWIYVSKPSWTIASMANWPLAFVQVHRLRRAYRPDYVFHASFRSVVLLGWLLGYNNVLCVHDQIAADKMSARLVPLFDKRIRLYLACSEFVSRDLQTLPLNSRKIVTFRNCVIAGNVRDEDGHDGDLRIGIVGQVKEAKGHETLFRALAALAGRNKPFSLHVFGSGEQKFIDRLRAMSMRTGLARRTTFHGFVADKARIYSTLDVVVVPSLREDPFPMSALEPAAHGLPVVASDRGGLSELVLPGRTGLSFPAGDSKALALNLERLIDEPELGRALGVAAYKRVRAEFSEEVMQRQLETIELH